MLFHLVVAFIVFFACNHHYTFSQIPTEISQLSLEEKVGQLLMVHFVGEEANAEAADLIQKDHIGGIIYYNWANGLKSPLQVQQLSYGLQALTKEKRLPIPLLIAVDQEGGLVARLTQGFTIFPGPQTIAETGDLDLAEQCAFVMGKELRAVGINVNLAPVVDISDVEHSASALRSFGSTPEIVIQYAGKVLHGFHRAHIMTAIKHFPGHGGVSVDSHEDLPILAKSKEAMDQMELKPFRMLAPFSDMVMTCHILAPALDNEHCATLSKKTLEGILRQELGYEGIIISDSLVMQGVLKNTESIDEAVIQAFEAGCDILVVGGRVLLDSKASNELSGKDVHRICQSLIAAVNSGRISTARLDRSVEKILALKNAYSVGKEEPGLLECVNSHEHRQVAETILKHSSKLSSIMPIAQKIWDNECGGKHVNLTCWNKGENFASLGIGHFIWYPEGEKETFKQTFPSLLRYLKSKGVLLPTWLQNSLVCPWKNRDDFYASIDSTRMLELRQMLFDTRHHQANFMVHRLTQAIPGMVRSLAEDQKKHVQETCEKMQKDPRGQYAILDYFNFKGEGTSQSETYNGEGWGLLQVFLAMPPHSENTVDEFVKAARQLLIKRVENSPSERNEKRWLKGWLNRVDSY